MSNADASALSTHDLDRPKLDTHVLLGSKGFYPSASLAKHPLQDFCARRERRFSGLIRAAANGGSMCALA
jgi:hypothetical protein